MLSPPSSPSVQSARSDTSEREKPSKSLPPKTRQKATHSKVRTGCGTCKARRVRCDETKPICLRCIRGKRNCTFAVQNASTSYDVTNVRLFENEKEKKYFDYALTEGTAVISLYKPFLTLVWSEIMAQIGSEHHHIIHSMAALGAIQSAFHDKYVKYIDDENANRAFTTALEEQNRAITLVRQKPVPDDVMILFTLLAHCLSSWKDKQAAPLIHLRAAQSMLKTYEEKATHSNLLRSPLIDKALQPIIMQFELEALTFTDGAHANRPLHKYTTQHDLDFSSKLTPMDALHRLEQLLKITFCLHNEEGKLYDELLKNDVQTATFKLSKILQHNVTAECDNQAAVENRLEYEMLMPHCLVLKIMLACGMDRSEMAYDEYTSHMAETVTWMETNLRNIRRYNQLYGGGMRVQFSFMAPLFFVATRCRDYIIRRSALELLHNSLRRERKLTSCMAARVARFVIEQEDWNQGLDNATSIRPECRIVLTAVEFARISQSMTITWKSASDESGGNDSLMYATVPYKPHLHADDGEAIMYMSRKILRASCYCGTLLMGPAIDCHCAD